jgi:hypothetical protein
MGSDGFGDRLAMVDDVNSGAFDGGAVLVAGAIEGAVKDGSFGAAAVTPNVNPVLEAALGVGAVLEVLDVLALPAEKLKAGVGTDELPNPEEVELKPPNEAGAGVLLVAIEPKEKAGVLGGLGSEACAAGVEKVVVAPPNENPANAGFGGAAIAGVTEAAGGAAAGVPPKAR